MIKYPLAKIISWAGDNGLTGRKRLQKVVYCLKSAGVSVDADFYLHHFGPYSWDVAKACDEMVLGEVLVESPASQKSYSYKLSDKGQELLRKAVEQPSKDMQALDEMEVLGKQLINEEIWALELGSTILFFQNQGYGDHAAKAAACEYKNVTIEGEEVNKAMAVAHLYKLSNV